MKSIAVITPYYKESVEVLRKCHGSVVSQSVAADHFFIADGHPNPELSNWNIQHVTLPRSHGDNGNTPRGIGCALADIQGYDFISFLDADNWLFPDHLESLLRVHQQMNAPICAAYREFYIDEGIRLDIVEPAEQRGVHIDTSCLLLHRSSFELNRLWLSMPKELGPICDRVFYSAIVRGRYPIAFSKKKTVGFRTQYEFHYRLAGLPVPAGVKPLTVLDTAWKYLVSKPGIDQCFLKMGFWPLTYIEPS